MSVRTASSPSIAIGRTLRTVQHATLLAGVSALTLFAISPAVHARALNGGGAGSVPAPNMAADAASQAARQAAAAAAQTQQSLARAARAVQDMQAVQAAARAAAAATQVSVTTPIAVSNGLGAGGLLPDMSRWNGANAPVQGTDGKGQTEVNIRQTTQQAILNWREFNVGARTTLTFDQQGRRDWVALNRVNNASAPSQILGTINADGHVYVINQSGIIFGGNSQVNVGSLIASTAGITDDQFRTNGIYSVQTGSSYTPSFRSAGGKVVVEAGGSINTHAPSSVTSGGGHVLLIGSQVENAGSIATPKGQTLLAAGDDFILRQGYGTEANQSSTTRGSEISPVIAAGSASGIVRNSGLVFAQQGDVTLAGRIVLQDGALIATTSVNTRGTIHLLNGATDTRGSVALGAGSLTTILPELESRDTALNSQRDALIAASEAANLLRASSATGAFDNLSLLADRLDQSRIEIVTGGNITFKSGSVTAAQGGQIAASASGRIVAETGAHLDVSGVRHVALAMESNNLQINLQGNELRDSPLNRDSEVLRSNNVWIDLRTLTLVSAGTGGYASDRYYTRGGLIEVGGYLANTAHGIGEWVSVGGTITLSAPEVVAQNGATFEISGGSLDYAGGWIRSTNLIGADGRRYSVDNAPADMTFVGFAGGFRRTHNIQGQGDERLTEIWTTVFDRGRHSMRWEDGYSVGRDAGRVVLSAPTIIFEADILADTVKGERQTSKRPADLLDGYKATQTTRAQNGTLSIGQYGSPGLVGAHGSDVIIGDVADIAGDASANTSLADLGRANTVWLDAAHLGRQNLGGIEIATRFDTDTETGGKITIDRTLKLADGGQVSLTAAVIDIKADVVARGGSVTASNQLVTREIAGGSVTERASDLLMQDGKSSVTLRSHAAIDTRGLWTNATSDLSQLSGAALLDGGSITLRSTGNVVLEAGSRIDTSSGAAIFANAQKYGRGGDVSLLAGYNGIGAAKLTLDGEIRGFGAAGGGTLSLSTSGVVVIGDANYEIGATLPAGTLVPADVTLREALVIPQGSPLPVAFTQTITSIAVGATLPTDVPFLSTTVAAEWVVPTGATGIAYVRPGTTAVVRAPAGTVVPAGSMVRGYSVEVPVLPGGYVLPVTAFPTGLRLTGPQSMTFMPGTAAPVSVTFAAGTVLRAGTLLAVDAKITRPEVFHVADGLLSRGFSKYSINGEAGLIVSSGAVVAPTMPVYQLANGSFATPTGSDPAAALNLWLPDVYRADRIDAEMIQRGGADLELLSGRGIGGDTSVLTGGGVTIAQGASITVDPGRKVTVASGGQIFVDGSITAHGGEISVLNVSRFSNKDVGGLSVWIGEHARLDASARAVTAVDIRGRIFGVVPDGGKVVLGSRGGEDTLYENAYLSADAYVVVRQGAVIDVSGTGAELDITTIGAAGQSAITRRTVASHGGEIALDSYQGIYNDGTLLARAGGVGASGGTLTINFEAPIYTYAQVGDIVPSRLQAGRAIRISEARQPSALPAGLRAGAAHADLKPGHASLSAEQVAEGGFDNLSLFARTAIVFEGDVNLAAGRSIALRASGIYNSVGGAHATVAAPYVTLDGQLLREAGQFSVLPAILPAYPTTGTLTVHGGLIDIVNRMNARVGKLTLDSDTDLRFLAYDRTPTSGAAGKTTALAVTGDIDLIAQRIYPATDARAELYAGVAIDVTGAPPFVSGATNTGMITINRHSDAPVAAPYSVFGALNMTAGTIRQGGNLLAPLGAISLIATSQQMVSRGLVEFLPGSLTSVSAKGLIMPYGGTVDGVSFTVNGSKPFSYDLLTGTIVRDADGNIIINSRSGRLGITATGYNVVTHAGSTLDLSGGGTLIGAGFVSGRGGSVDVLVNALADANPGYRFSKSGNPVYAIVPGVVIAPRTGGYSTAWNGAAPGIGEQITILAGVPGLPAGTYTLLPANYALLPGAYRVELGAAGTTGLAAPRSLTSGSYLTSATHGVGNTSIIDSLATSVIVTPGATLRTYSQFNEQGYESFLLAQAANFGTARPLLSVDGKFLTFNLSTLATGSAPRVESALIFDGFADFAPGKGGYAGTLSISGYGGSNRSSNTDMAITGAGSTTVRTNSVTTVAASEIADVGASNLYVGSGPGSSYTAGNPVFELTANDGLVRSLTLESGVVLSGSQVILAANNGGITVKSGASVNTLGRGLQAPDTVATGMLFSAPAMLAVSNGSISLEPWRFNTTSRITLEGGSSLYSEGSIAFTAGQGVVLQDGARFGTRDLELALPYINIGAAEQLAAAAAAGILPAGLSLDQVVLDRLVQGDPVTGAPGMKNLILSAGNSINFYGSVNLSTLDKNGKSVLESFVLSTPAIYGHGNANDSVTLTTDRLVWSSRAFRSVTPDGSAVYTPAAPGAIIANGPGTGYGVFNFDAREILFGYLEQSRPLNTVQFNRLMLGFETVNLNASERITSNNINTLAVWRTGPSPASDFNPATYAGEAAALNLVTPLLTGDNGSVLSIYSSGTLRVVAPQGGPAGAASVDTLGATINLASVQGAVKIDTAVALPSGKLTVKADQTIQIDDGTRIDLAGRAIPFKDVTKYSWGGDLVLESAHSSIIVQGGATFDVSAVSNHAGSVTLSATDGAGGGGIVFVNPDGTPLQSIDGTFKGSSTVGYESGAFKLTVHFIGPAGTQNESFARINAALNAGGFFQTREFALKQGDLAIGNEVRAHNVVVSVDNGSLTVLGRIDASGAAPGSIRLSAKNDLAIASGAVLDVHGTELQTDSDGVAIEAKNRGGIELTATTGWLRLNPGATLDLGSPDGVKRGKLVLNAGRTGETSGDARIDATAPLDIRGAAGIALNAFWTYSPTDADGSIVQDNGGADPVAADGAVGLNQIGARNVQFINAALANASLAGRTAGLSAYGDAYHLRPGVEISGNSSSNGNLTVKGNLDLASLRTSDEAYSATESGSLVVRAPGNLTVNGSITDGFGNPVANPNDIMNSTETLTRERWLDVAVISGATTIPTAGTTLTFDLVLGGTSNSVRRGGVVIPFEYKGLGLTVRADAVSTGGVPGLWTLTGSITLAANLVVSASVPNRTVALPNGGPTYVAGQTIPAGTVLPAGTVINIGLLNGASTNFILPTNSIYGAGTTLPGTGTMSLAAGTVIPGGTNLAAVMGGTIITLQAGQTLRAGTYLPVGTKLIASLPIANYAAAPMLAPGSESWSIRLVSGADAASADTRAVQSLPALGAGGNMLLSNSLINAAGKVLPSVIRTGTGDLDLVAGRDLTQDTPFGVYTAGTQIDVGGAYAGVTSQGGYFTENGGDLTITTGRNLTGYLYVDNPSSIGGQTNYSVGNWLVRQGDATTPAAWAIRFGAYGGPNANIFYGFSAGFGALGGGNVNVDVGGDAGALGAVTNSGSQIYASTGLLFAVGGSGRVTSVTKTSDGVVTGGTLLQTGGGNLSVDVGGRLNPVVTPNNIAPDDLYGSFTNVRGDIAVQAGAIGSALLAFGVGAPNDPRAVDLYGAARLSSDGGVGGPVVVIGDGSASLQARGDLIFGGAGDPGMIYASGTSGPAFSLWRPDSAITLFSAGGNMVPLNVAQYTGSNEAWGNEDSTNQAMMTPIFEAVAAQGSLYWAGRQRIELAPSRDGYLELLAGNSIYAAAFNTGSSISTPVAAAWTVSSAAADPNSIPNPFRPGTSNSYFQFQADTVTTNLHAGDDKLIRVYAMAGDIVNFTLGDPTVQIVNGENLPRYRAAMPARIYAGRDIVNFGKNAYRSQFGQPQFVDTPSLILNNDATDISSIEAGRDILYAQVQVAGPGSLEVVAGRNLYLGDKGSIVSIGALAAGDTRSGASILMQAGAGAAGPNYAGLLPYLDVANLAAIGTPLAGQPGKVAKTYEKELQAWLKERFGFAVADAAEARAYFVRLPAEQQNVFLRQVYFAELRAGGREYNDPDSSRYGSYLRGRSAIAALFPEMERNGNPISYRGDITMFGGSGVRTEFGGNIEMFAPGGQVLVGLEGQVPPATSGLITQGAGDVQLYARGSILLGLSRIMTTFGGDILAWSATGDINAGRGAKTTVIYTTPKRTYDLYGNVTLSPDAPSSGAGIATLNPIPEVEPGDIDLIAPLGTIDAGEAGIRVSGNVNLAALQILNAANIQVQGTSMGIPTVQAPNITAALAATNATAATQQTATPTQGSGNSQPSVIIVEVLGYGGGGAEEDGSTRKRRPGDEQTRANEGSVESVRVLGSGPITREQLNALTDEEKMRLLSTERSRL